MKKIIKVLVILTSLGLSSCQSDEVITPKAKTVLNAPQAAVSNETEPPIVPATGGPPK